MCEALRDPRAKGICNDREMRYPYRRGEVEQRISIVSGAGYLTSQIVGQEIARRIPGDQPEPVSQFGPGQKDGPIGFLMYPYAESPDGTVDSLDPATFAYSIFAQEIV